ncbi:MAG: type II toxin-antitoxin system VapC family toxin [Verrucomicrobiales bacterium]|nr:type II toxin-antitoxin system VapC family toxin [Verrucomicrobiales bacterium]
MKRTYLDSSVLIHAVQGGDGGGTVALLEDPGREFVAATFLKLELLPQPSFHRRARELAFLEEFFSRIVAWEHASEVLLADALHEAAQVPLSAVDAIHVAAARRLQADEFVTGEKPGKPLHQVKGIRVVFLAAGSARGK